MSESYGLMLDDWIHSYFGDFASYLAIFGLGNDGRLADFSDTSQSLTAESIAAEIKEILFSVDLGSRISFK